MRVVMNGKRIQELREEKGWSKRDLAEAAGIVPKTAHRIEREEPIRVTTTKKVGAELEVNPRTIAQVYHDAREEATVRKLLREYAPVLIPEFANRQA